MGQQGYKMLLTVFVRPPLMVAGLLVSIFLINVCGKFVGEMFQIFNSGMNARHFGGPVTVIAMLVILLGVAIIMSHKVFGLITHLPESISRWIGNVAFGGDEKGEERRVSGMFAATSSKVEHKVAGSVPGMKGGHKPKQGSHKGPGSGDVQQPGESIK